MNTHAATLPAAVPAPALAGAANRCLLAGIVGLVATLTGLFVSPDPTKVAMSWLLGITFWSGLALGMLFLVMIHHIFDAGWSVVLRRQWEHGLAAFKWLALMFLPLILLSAFYKPALLWKWMDPAYELPGGYGTVGADLLFVKKAGYLNLPFFTVRAALFFGAWCLLAWLFRRNSFAQDADGDPKWTRSSRVHAAWGLFAGAITVSFASIDWLKSLEYHWFSTIYGVWFFSTAIRATLAVTVLVMIYLWRKGRYSGVINNHTFHSIGQLALAFTVFWAYIAFSQYFLIWNANIPEETFWYNIREHASWHWIGMGLLFGYFLFPFLFLLSYRYKLVHGRMIFISIWILVFFLLDLYYNISPFKKDAAGDPLPFMVRWSDVTALVGIGGICVWAYLRSFVSQKLIPVRDPRILESVTHHE